MSDSVENDAIDDMMEIEEEVDEVIEPEDIDDQASENTLGPQAVQNSGTPDDCDEVGSNEYGQAQAVIATPATTIPIECVDLKMRCPVNCPKPSKRVSWTCNDEKCGVVFRYDFKGNVYCSCGKSEIARLLFKCPHPEENSFEQPKSDALDEATKQIEPLKNMNILILGETGVGKSTWINGFVNFVSYETLEDAERGDLNTLVPAQFTVYNENYEEILVSTGTDTNEVLHAGQSATQAAKVYPFRVGNSLIRIIDTPGIGDTRGPTQDQENFENILGTISHLDELHGICILLKPNNARLNVMFRFCIKELLTYLHRDASRNIMFCFTNSRSTFYRPGDTMPALVNLLTEHKEINIPRGKDNIFCYDSEAYRFLAAVKNKNPVSFSDSDRQNFCTSWSKSIDETRRMIEYITSLKPHKINNTLNLNNTRQLVLKLARPLAEINRNIQLNKKIVEDCTKDLQNTADSIEELQKKRMTKRTTISNRPLNHPKTVCKGNGCVSLMPLLGTKESVSVYTKACHDPCGLSGIQADSIGAAELMGCCAMNSSNNCDVCGHRYTEHLHVYYESEQVMEDIVDEEIDEKIKNGCSAQQVKEAMLTQKATLLSEYEYEIKEIENACAHFALFLKTNAITPYNDAVLQYIDHFIREEKEKVAAGGESMILVELTKSQQSYIEQKRILDNQLPADGEAGIGSSSQEEIWEMVENLKQLKHSGKNLREALACVTHTQKSYFASSFTQVPMALTRDTWASRMGKKMKSKINSSLVKYIVGSSK